jgi:crossover junction endodeoxyribonuclease RuvC
MRILGVDCGSRVTGYGVIDTAPGGAYRYVDCGAIRTRTADPMALRLRSIHAALQEVIRDQRPDVAVFESVFHAANAQSALKLGHARGVSMFAAAQAELPVHEYTALQVKAAVTGYGRAEKAQVQQMVRALLKLAAAPEPHDVSDALAVAICHAQSYRHKEATAVHD